MVINEHVAHGKGCRHKKVIAIVPRPSTTLQSNERFVDKRCWLQSVMTESAHLAASPQAQIRIERGKKTLERIRVAGRALAFTLIAMAWLRIWNGLHGCSVLETQGEP